MAAIQLSDHFTYKKLLRFVFPSIIMMIFTSIYGVVDGFFVSNYVGEEAFEAVNFIMPFLMLPGALGFMFGTGGSAIIAHKLGEGDKERANRYFSLLVYVGLGLGIVLAAVCIVFLRPIAVFLGADESMLDYCVRYGTIILCALPALVLQFMFQSFFVTAEKPKLGLFVTLAAGFTNIILDFFLVGVFRLNIEGAAAATALSQAVGGILPLFYFFSKNKSLLRLGKTRWEGRALLNTCINGSSELMTNLSMSLVNMLYNFQLMKFLGNDGIAAYGTIMYVNFIFVSIFIGFAVGSAPIISFHYGAGNHAELKNILKKSIVFNGVCSIAMFLLALALARPLSTLFVGYNPELLELTIHGFSLYAIAFLLMGFNIYASSFFTALGNGVISAAISFLRTLLFQIAGVLLLPMIWKADGIWLSITVAEAAAVILSFVFLMKNRKRYGY
ncbi:MAG: MATE family efflux transporter [Clostridia bacterium]|nr:MATE family efflux transporter [Clostridia bacterium]